MEGLVEHVALGIHNGDYGTNPQVRGYLVVWTNHQVRGYLVVWLGIIREEQDGLRSRTSIQFGHGERMQGCREMNCQIGTWPGGLNTLNRGVSPTYSSTAKAVQRTKHLLDPLGNLSR